ncbi:MAG: helix-turn-helix domain-containing protein [Nitrospira sp.]|nr:helix-turn-helix domain-containing protein [Nitrospira sp.]
MPKKRSYTLTEAAKKLKISKQAILKAIRAGRFKGARLAVVKRKEWQIPIEAVDRFKRERGLKSA